MTFAFSGRECLEMEISALEDQGDSLDVKINR